VFRVGSTWTRDISNVAPWAVNRSGKGIGQFTELEAEFKVRMYVPMANRLRGRVGAGEIEQIYNGETRGGPETRWSLRALLGWPRRFLLQSLGKLAI